MEYTKTKFDSPTHNPWRLSLLLKDLRKGKSLSGAWRQPAPLSLSHSACPPRSLSATRRHHYRACDCSISMNSLSMWILPSRRVLIQNCLTTGSTWRSTGRQSSSCWVWLAAPPAGLPACRSQVRSWRRSVKAKQLFREEAAVEAADQEAAVEGGL